MLDSLHRTTNNEDKSEYMKGIVHIKLINSFIRNFNKCT